VCSAGPKARVPQANSRKFFWLKPPQNDAVLGSEFFFRKFFKKKFGFDRWAPNGEFAGPDNEAVGQWLFWAKIFIFLIFYICVINVLHQCFHIQKKSFFISSLSKNCAFFLNTLFKKEGPKYCKYLSCI